MKIRTLFLPLLLAFLAQIIVVQAADLYLVNMRGKCSGVNSSDKISGTPFNTTSMLREFAALQDPPMDPRDLRLVYDPEADTISIVDVFGEVFSDVFTFGFPTVVANSTETLRERHVFLFAEGSSDATGSAIVSERITRGGETNGIVKLTSKGSMQFVKPAVDETPAQVCSGTFTVGRKLILREPEPDEEP